MKLNNKGEKYKIMTVKDLYQIILAIIGISSLAGLCLVFILVAGIFL